MNRVVALVLAAIVVVAAVVIAVLAAGRQQTPDEVQTMAADYAAFVSRTGPQFKASCGQRGQSAF
jgi:hypothetical protein